MVDAHVKDKLAQIRRLRGRKRLAEAQAALDDLGAGRTDDPLIEAERVFLQVDRREPGVLALAEQAAARHPGSAACQLALAEATLRADPPDPEMAAAAAGRAVALWSSPLSWQVLARAERARGRDAEALAAVRRGLTMDPGHARLRGMEAELLRALGRPEEAARATAALPDGPWKQRLKLADALANLPPEEAEAELAGLAALEPDRPEVHDLLGTRLYRAGRYPEAAQAFLRALGLQPNNPYYRKMAGFALGKAGEPTRAAALLRPEFLDDPLDRHVQQAFFAACRKAGDVDGLRAAIDEALARHPHAGKLHGLRKKWAPEPAPPPGPDARREPGS